MVQWRCLGVLLRRKITETVHVIFERNDWNLHVVSFHGRRNTIDVSVLPHYNYFVEDILIIISNIQHSIKSPDKKTQSKTNKRTKKNPHNPNYC